VYFACDRAPVDEPILVLDGDGSGPANHLAVPSVVAPSYAPHGAHLVSASVVGRAAGLPEDELVAAVRAQLSGWFGEGVARFRTLRVVRVPRSLPSYAPPTPGEEARSSRRGGALGRGGPRGDAVDPGGDASGRRTAEAILSQSIRARA
jgi:hypothetical protein